MDPQNNNTPESPQQNQPVPMSEYTPQPMPPQQRYEQPNPSNGQQFPQQLQPDQISSPPKRLSERAEKLKRLSIQIMIGGLIAAAALAVVAVLVGSFNETFGKALFTLFLVIIHALACLAFVEQSGKANSSNFRFFENAVFFIIVLSFFTSIFGVWGILPGSIVARLYGTYFILLFACLHGQMLIETRGVQPKINTIVNVNYVMMSLVVLLMLPIIWLAGGNTFPGFYYRLLAACGIIDATLTILAVILYKLYVQKHPEIKSAIFGTNPGVQPGSSTDSQAHVTERKRQVHPLMWLLGIYIVGQIIVSILFGAFRMFQ